MTDKEMTESDVNWINNHIKTFPDEYKNNISDGYHTFGELYEHRIQLFIALCKTIEEVCLFETEASYGSEIKSKLNTWKSKIHSDGTFFDGWFILGICKEKGIQITYHLPISKWDECDFAKTMEKAPEYDGHTPADILERLKNL